MKRFIFIIEYPGGVRGQHEITAANGVEAEKELRRMIPTAPYTVIASAYLGSVKKKTTG